MNNKKLLNADINEILELYEKEKSKNNKLKEKMLLLKGEKQGRKEVEELLKMEGKNDGRNKNTANM